MTLQAVTATCASNGQIKVTFSGSDVVNIGVDSVQLQVDGVDVAVSRPWAKYSGNIITGLPKGTYTISMRAFCKSINDWLVYGNAKNVTVNSTYTETDAYTGAVRKSLSCAPTGMVPIIVKSYTGSAPFTITITGAPAGYTGSTSFTLDRPYISSTVTKKIEGLPAGSYTFVIEDNCSYSLTKTVTVGAMTQDFQADLFGASIYPAYNTLSDECNVVGIDRRNISKPADETYYADSLFRYYDVGFKYNNQDPMIWIDSAVAANIYKQHRIFNITLPVSIKTFRASTGKLTPYLRVKGTTDPACTFPLSQIDVTSTIYINFQYDDVECDRATVKFRPNTTNYGALCYPYKWRITDNLGVVIPGYDWSADVYDATEQVATNVPYGSIIKFRDHEGYEWSSTTSIPSPTASQGWTYCESSNNYTADTLHHYLDIRFSDLDSIPAGTTFDFVSGPATPVHTHVVTDKKIRSFYPFSSDYTKSNYAYIPAGYYIYNVTLPSKGGNACVTRSVSLSSSLSFVKIPFTYETIETCGGLKVIPTGGQIARKSPDGTITDVATYYVIGLAPSSVSRNPVTLGDTLYFPTSGRYIFGLTTSFSASACITKGDTLNYVRTPFRLDPEVTASYVCEQGNGFIRVAGSGGSGNYSYELYDHGVKKQTNTTGVFNYGEADSTYTIRLIDNDPSCAASYDQDVRMLDLSTISILYTGSPTNTYCSDEDSVYLKCVTLGQTTYTWSGPGINTTDPASPAYKNRQNPVIAISQLGLGTHTFSIRVTPEGCGAEIHRTISVKVEDCNGAQDDYHVQLINTTDSIDVLANDGFPSVCAGSVTPVITVSPTRGTAGVVNKKVVYTPATDFTGRDSLTYSTTCSGTTTTAKVYITIVPLPDNIVDADCYTIPPVGIWSIKEIATSTTFVNNYMIPVIGDIDNDGKVEIIVAKNSTTNGGDHNANILTIFEMVNNILVVQQDLSLGTFVNNIGSNMAIANVDGGPYAAIFIATSSIGTAAPTDGQQAVNLQRKLVKYVFNGAQYVAQIAPASCPQYSNVLQRDAAQPMLADFNGDGIPEVVVLDKVYNAQTLELLVDGGILLNTFPTANYQYGLGYGGHMNNNRASNINHKTSHMAIADMDNDGIPEIVAGHCVYKVDITNPGGTSGNTFSVWSKCDVIGSNGETHQEVRDGATTIADMDGDGYLDVIVLGFANAANNGAIFVWNPRTKKVMHTTSINNLPSWISSLTCYGPSRALAGDVDNDGLTEIVFLTSPSTTAGRLYCYGFDPDTKTLNQKWILNNDDNSGGTTLTLFDFDSNGSAELVYRDQSSLFIINGVDGSVKARFNGIISATANEYPLIADVNNDGRAEIVVTGSGRLHIFSSDPSGDWAPARKVWNQVPYNVVNVNDDLTIPKQMLNPATAFPGVDRLLGTTDDIKPFNNFLQQQTMMDKNGLPLWLTPDVYTVSSVITTSVSGNSVTVNVGVINQGEAAIGSPVYVTLYKNTVAAANKIITGSANIQINPGDTGYVSLTIPDITLTNPVRIVIRLNDDGTNFLFQPECDDTNNTISILNPTLSRLMKKDARLLLTPPVPPDNGFYANPVSTLFSETIEYTITAINANLQTGTVIIRDTLPAYLDYLASVPAGVVTTVGSTPPR
ncbi:MAG: VCBS repeat-containing protein, partial [Tannerella sp.]|nr:VCBS repeat-containing protein [Tannerella sp.]